MSQPPKKALRVISFLGKNDMTMTTYKHPQSGATVTSKFAPYAVHTLYGANETLVLCTPDARSNYKQLCEEHADAYPAVRCVDIQNGQTQAELWDIFQRLTNEIPEGDDVVFDITNGFRSSPVLISTALRFLQQVRNVRVQRVVYGAFDQRVDDVTPIVDLQPFLDLQNWVDAAHAFTHYGNGEELAKLVSGMKLGTRAPWHRIAQCVRRITSALQLVHLNPLDQYTREFTTMVTELEVETGQEFTPIHLVLTTVVAAFADFHRGDSPRHELIRQQNVLRWYLDHAMYAQAIIIAQEWIECYYLFRMNRQLADEVLLNMFATDRKNLATDGLIRSASHADTDIANKIRQLRNATAHATLMDPIEGTYDAMRLIREYCDVIVSYPIEQ